MYAKFETDCQKEKEYKHDREVVALRLDGENGWKRDGQDKFDWNCFAHGKFGAGQLDGGVGETKMNLV